MSICVKNENVAALSSSKGPRKNDGNKLLIALGKAIKIKGKNKKYNFGFNLMANRMTMKRSNDINPIYENSIICINGLLMFNRNEIMPRK